MHYYVATLKVTREGRERRAKLEEKGRESVPTRGRREGRREMVEGRGAAPEGARFTRFGFLLTERERERDIAFLEGHSLQFSKCT